MILKWDQVITKMLTLQERKLEVKLVAKLLKASIISY